MVFDYYHRLGRKQKAVYLKSDAVEQIVLHNPPVIQPAVIKLENALETGDRLQTERASAAVIAGVINDLGVVPVRTRVLSARPASNWGELHGLYEPVEGRTAARITVWMRTARHKRVVAFRSFLRTILHELCHHLDYEMLRLPDSYHTEGFFKRESSLYRQLVAGRQD